MSTTIIDSMSSADASPIVTEETRKEATQTSSLVAQTAVTAMAETQGWISLYLETIQVILMRCILF